MNILEFIRRNNFTTYLINGFKLLIIFIFFLFSKQFEFETDLHFIIIIIFKKTYNNRKYEQTTEENEKHTDI